MKTITKLSSVFVGLLMILAAISPALALSNQITAQDMNIARINGSNVSSTNWSGYAVTGSSVSSVTGSWVVPTMTPGASPTTTYYGAFWVGIDGYSSSTVEQTGILAETTGSTTTYLAWFEFYPNPMYEIVQTTTVNHKTVSTPAPVAAGDIIVASVKYTSTSGGFGFGSQDSGSETTSTILGDATGAFYSPTFAVNSQSNVFSRSSSQFTVTITDESSTHGWTFSTSSSVSAATRSSAEWIAEAPSSSSGVLPLANFGNPGVSFSSCSAIAASGTLTPLSSTVNDITMVSKSGTTKAQPSAVGPDGKSFSVAFVSAGP